MPPRGSAWPKLCSDLRVGEKTVKINEAAASAQGEGEQELPFAAGWLLSASHCSPAYLCQLRVEHVLLSPGCSQMKSPMHINFFPDYLLPDARAEGFLRGRSLGANTPSAIKSCDGGGHRPAGSRLLCGAMTNCTRTCVDKAEPGQRLFRAVPPFPAVQCCRIGCA